MYFCFVLTHSRPKGFRMLDTLPTAPNYGGPYVMWKGKPYAHIMVPVGTLKDKAFGGNRMPYL